MPATSIEPSMIAAMETSEVMPARVATVTMPMMGSALWPLHEIADKQISRGFILRAHRQYVTPVGTQMGPGNSNHCEQDDNENDRKNDHIDLIAAATAAAATAAAAGEPARWLGRSAVARSIRRAENRKLQSILLPRALWTGNLLRLIQNNLLKVRLAILANVFVNRHRRTSVKFLSIITAWPDHSCIPKSDGPRLEMGAIGICGFGQDT